MQTQIIKKKIETFVIPFYNELVFSTMSMALLLIIFFNNKIELSDFRPEFMVYGRFLIILIIGLYLPILHIFVTRKKTELEKFLIQTFSVTTNIIIGLYLISYVYNTSPKWYYIFPAWDSIYAVIIPVLVSKNIISVDQAFDKESSLKEIIICGLALVITFYVSQYFFDLNWAVTFSVCIISSTSLTWLLNYIYTKMKPPNQSLKRDVATADAPKF